MVRKIIFATGNEGKMREIRLILADLGVEILSLKDAGIEVEIQENGKTFEENAVIKAKTVMEASRLPKRRGRFPGLRRRLSWRMIPGWKSTISTRSRGFTRRGTWGRILLTTLRTRR